MFSFIQDNLINVTKIAQEVGFTQPVAITQTCWMNCVAWDKPKKNDEYIIQDEACRLWNLLWTACLTCDLKNIEQGCLFKLYCFSGKEHSMKPRLITLFIKECSKNDDHYLTIEILEN